MKNKKSQKKYYVGLNITPDAVGYAVSGKDHALRKIKGEPAWGVSTFEKGENAKDRRLHRIGRRVTDRRQQRVFLINDLFAKAVCEVDPNFFIRRKESSLFAEDTTCGVSIFDGEGITDKEYYKKYPTIHHLIHDLMTSNQPHDVRLVYLACAWLVAHRGHFLFDVSPENVGSLMNFTVVYEEFCDYLWKEVGCILPWPESVEPNTILKIMQMNAGVTKKTEAFKAEIYDNSKISKEPDDLFPFSRIAIVKLLSGAKVKPADVFFKEEYADTESISLQMNDEDFVRIISELGDDGELLQLLRNMQDCSQLISTMKYAKEEDGMKTISSAKVAIYDQHKADLKWLKYFFKKYLGDKYSSFFRNAGAENYVAYSYNVKSCAAPKDVKKKANKEVFSAFLLKLVKGIEVEEKDADQYLDMLNRLESRTFLPKQKESTNRVIPQQLYRYELAAILDKADAYLPFLREADKDGLTNKSKILSVFDFKIPYYVGPLCESSKSAWLVRKADGKILPWNFAEKVDLDASEQAFINRMTGTCTYLPGEDVLPLNSLIYSKYMVLNEINTLKVNCVPISVKAKQGIYTDLFKRLKKVTKKQIVKYLKDQSWMADGDDLSGIDAEIKSSLKPYHIFARMLDEKTLTEEQVEDIISHATYSQEKSRLRRWLAASFPQLSADDIKYIGKQNFKDFGRLSKTLLTGVYGTSKSDPDGEAFTIIEALWNTNNNLMQLLSDRYTFSETISALEKGFYLEKPKSLSDRLTEMYVSNAAKRPIFRAFDVLKDIETAMGCPPARIFIEMAREGDSNSNDKTKKTRKELLLDLYKKAKNAECRKFAKKLEDLGKTADNKLQSDKLFLYFLQLGKCLYTGNTIDPDLLETDPEKHDDEIYNIDHIYPKQLVNDDNLFNNKILVEKDINQQKDNKYPVPEDIRKKMCGLWQSLKDAHLMTEEKYRRLTRDIAFTADEKQEFIDRHINTVRQSTKAVATILKEKYPDTEIVYVKGSLVSDFRQEFSVLRSKAVNDLHYAKDAYLDIIVGDVYHERFTKRWFSIDSKYNVQIEKIFKSILMHGDDLIWAGEADVDRILKTLEKNAVHLTRYSFCRKGGLFDQQPVKAAPGLIPLKTGKPTEKYGGYNKATGSFYLLVSCMVKKNPQTVLIPVELMYADKVLNDPEFAANYVAKEISDLNSGKEVSDIKIMLDARPIKVQTTLSLDGLRVAIAGKSGAVVLIRLMTPLIVGKDQERYIKRLDAYLAKKKENSKIQLDAKHDKITTEDNIALYDILLDKLENSIFAKCPGNIGPIVRAGRKTFEQLSAEDQVACLMNIVSWFSYGASSCDLTAIGGAGATGSKTLAMKMTLWSKRYSDVRIIDTSASGIYESCSENLLEY